MIINTRSLTFFISSCLILVSGIEFGYYENENDGPNLWGLIDLECFGFLQSPVNIISRFSSLINFPQFSYFNFEKKPTALILHNNIAYVSFYFTYGNDTDLPYITGGPLLQSRYIVDSLQIHWGEDDETGSEHAIDGTKFSAEMQLLAYNSDYSSMDEAKEKSNGIAAVSYFYQGKEGIEIPNNFFVYIPYLEKPTYTVDLDANTGFTLSDVIKPFAVQYYSYKGSLTTPSCNEHVTWLIMNTPVFVDPGYINYLRKLKDSDGEFITRNYRPIQLGNGRTLLRNFEFAEDTVTTAKSQR